jgi:lipopolysaccharide biosynthesis protein
MKRLCLFSCFHEGREILPYQRFYLSKLRPHCDELVFITNERSLDDDALSFLKDKDISINMVYNRGMDFGMWRKTFIRMNPNQYSQVCFANDSCLVNGDLDRVFEWVENNDLDYCGITDSAQNSYHVQSYFIVVKKSCLKTVHDYYRKNGVPTKKGDIVRLYEIGLSTHMQEKGFKIGAMYPWQTVSDVEGMNVSLYRPNELLDAGCPLLKMGFLYGHRPLILHQTRNRPLPELEPRHVKSLNEQFGTFRNPGKAAIIIHLYFQEMWEELKEKIQKVQKAIDSDLYVSVCDEQDTDAVAKSIEEIGGKVFKLPNRGLDIGPFLLVLKHIFESGLDYQYLLKMHGKKGHNPEKANYCRKWRLTLTNCLAGSEENIQRHLDALQNENIFMTTDRPWLRTTQYKNTLIIQDIAEELNIEHNNSMTFPGGTMFWAKMSLFKRYFTVENLSSLYDSLEDGAFNDKEGGKRTHTLERIFGYLANQKGRGLLGIESAT